MPKALSIIVASQDAQATVVECLSSLEKQNQNGGAEIIVVDNSRDGTTQLIQQEFSHMPLVKVAEPSLVPQLWGLGAQQAAGQVIAFTTTHFIPEADWLSQILRHHQSEYAAVGGAIENRLPSSLTQWAVYFCRYAGYMLPFTPHTVAQVPGDNASYKRWVLEKYADLIKDGFWETVVNSQLSRDGHSLLLTPEVRVQHGRSFGLWAFCRQRLVHGRIFGAERAAAASPARRLLYIAFSPLVPLAFLGKITRQVLANGRHRGVFLFSLPLLILFILCWSLGESTGYLLGNASTDGAKG